MDPGAKRDGKSWESDGRLLGEELEDLEGRVDLVRIRAWIRVWVRVGLGLGLGRGLGSTSGSGLGSGLGLGLGV